MTSGAVELRSGALDSDTGSDRRPGAARLLARNWPDRFELAVLAVFALGSVWVLALDLWRTATEGYVWTGINGVIIQDPLQYLAWIQDASRHLMVSDLFVLRPTPHDYLQPAITISGALVAIGVVPWIALLIWQPIAVGAVFAAIRLFVRDQLSGRWRRRVALLLALFGGALGMDPDLWLPFWTWGYSFGVLALAAGVGALLLYDRAVRTGGSVWPAAVLGGLASWLHPWLGGVLILVVGGAAGWMWFQGARRAFAPLAATLVAIALPLAYYYVLERTDPTWRLGGQANQFAYPVGRLALTLAPLAVPAMLAYRVRPRSFTAAAARIWPLAALAVFLSSEHGFGNAPTHALIGISVPLAVLAVEGVGQLRWPALTPRRTLAVLAVLALSIPVAIDQFRGQLRRVRPNVNRIMESEWRAVSFLSRNPEPGGVLTAYHLGVFIPGETGRRTYVGTPYWSQPNPRDRNRLTWLLFTGYMHRRQARAFVLGSGAGFVLTDCKSRATLAQLLAPISDSVDHFGCAAVYDVAATGPYGSHSRGRNDGIGSG